MTAPKSTPEKGAPPWEVVEGKIRYDGRSKSTILIGCEAEPGQGITPVADPAPAGV